MKKFRSDPLSYGGSDDHEVDPLFGNPRPRIHAFLVSLACDQSNPESIKKSQKFEKWKKVKIADVGKAKNLGIT